MENGEFDAEVWRNDRYSFEAWKEESGREKREDLRSVKRKDEADPVAGLLLFLADGYALGVRTLALRAAVFVMLMRPDLLGDSPAEAAEKLGYKVGTVRRAIRVLRELAPGLAAGFVSSQTSQARLVALGQIRRRRRELALADLEALAMARRNHAAERVKLVRDKAEERRLRVARRTLALASEIQRAAAKDMRDFDLRLRVGMSRPRAEEGDAAPLRTQG